MKGVSILAAALLAGVAQAAATWPRAVFEQVPAWHPAPQYATNGVNVGFFDGLPWRGRPTRVFAYWGVPRHAPGAKVPGMVLVHGGGGSAFYRWVKFWNNQGYAAISMDTCGCVSGNVLGDEQRRHFRHEQGGPKGWGGFDTLDQPVEDQWMYHAVADAVLGHTFLRAQEGVDAGKIGVTGVSWGGIITSIAASVDPRFQFAAPVYGSGALYRHPGIAWTNATVSTIAKWEPLWDPINYLPRNRTPIFWLDGTNDRHFTLPAINASLAATPAREKGLVLRVRMAHAHGAVSERTAEIVALADQYLKGGPALPRVGAVALDQGVASCPAVGSGPRAPVKASLDYTLDAAAADGQWFERFWRSAPATLANGRVSVALPPGTRAFYLNVETAAGERVSTPVMECPTSGKGR